MTMALALILRVDGSTAVKDLKTATEIHAVINGWLEGLAFGDGVFAYINEDGKMLKLPMNKYATMLADFRKVGMHPQDYIAGTIVFFGSSDLDGNNTDVPREFVDLVHDIFKSMHIPLFRRKARR
jgi:hypothetical protein